ncbi:MAG: glutamate--cysteine ligase [Pseudomonadota bacterium]
MHIGKTGDAITDPAQLAGWMQSGCKPRDNWRIGTEHEKFGFRLDGHGPVPYEGPDGIGALLDALHTKLGWKPYLDEGNVIALVDPKTGASISLEPGGQFELSGAPLETIHETCTESNAHLSVLRKCATPLGIGFLGLGASPKWSLAETPRMPKSRYDIMTRYMPTVGSMGLDMMYRTATIQVNIDFESEADMREKFQIALKLQPLASALFANSPFTEGKPNGHLTWRSHIWSDVDNRRAGLLPFVFSSEFGFEAYAEWAQDVPMYFIIRDGHYIEMTDVTFRQYLQDGKTVDGVTHRATFGDWDDHLTTLFPDARIKRYMEMRGADGGPWRRICALPAFWIGLLYDADAQARTAELVKDWTLEEVQALRAATPDQALRTQFRDTNLRGVGRQVLDICRDGLKSRNRLNSSGLDETVFLPPLEETVVSGITSAEAMLKKYHSVWQGDLDRVFIEYAY